MRPEVVAAFVGPVVGALLAAAGVSLREWRQRRDREHRRNQVLNETATKVALIDTWMQAYERVAGARTHEQVRPQAQHDLEVAYATMTRRLGELDVDDRPVTFRRLWKSLFLLSQLTTRRGRIARLAYYLSLVNAAIWLGGFSAILIEEGFAVLNIATFLFGISLLAVAPMLLIRSGVIAFDRWAARVSKAS